MSKVETRKALGKGLHALLPARNAVVAVAVAEPVGAPSGNVQAVSIEQITPNPNQPRRDFDAAALMDLTRSIERDGMIQPIIVRKVGSGYQIIAGERRWRAAKAAGLVEVPVIVRSADDQQVIELALVENIQREDLNPIELAIAFQRMASELGLSHDQIGHKTGKERTTITNSVRLLQLPLEIQGMISSKQLSAGHARALLKFQDGGLQKELAARCMAEGWSVRQIEQYTPPDEPKIPRKKAKAEAHLDPNVKFALEELERALGTKVRIVERLRGSGRIEIEYFSAEDLSRIYERIMGEPE